MSKEFENYLKARESALSRAMGKIEKYESKGKGYEVLAGNAKKEAKYHQDLINVARPESLSDNDERRRIMETYPELIRNNVSKDNPLFFHGVQSITFVEDILSSGHLGYLEDEVSRSQTSPGMLDVTTANNIDTSIKDFTGLNVVGERRFLPAGCLFAIAPKDDKEKAYANQDTGTEHSIATVDFTQNPERIAATISTNENKDYLLNLANKYNIDKSKIYTFDSFIEHLSQRNQEKSNIQEATDQKTPSNNVEAQIPFSRKLAELRGISSSTEVPYKPQNVKINPNVLHLHQSKKQNA